MTRSFLSRLTALVLIVLAASAAATAADAEPQPDLLQALGRLFKPKSEALAAEPSAQPVSEPSAAARAVAVPAGERRVALVIGNNAYRNVNKLDNAVPDARAMAREFRGLGFEVIEQNDVDQRAMKAAVRDFVGRVANGGVGAFFFAGHGVQEGGNNYLLPVDISALTDAAALPDEAVELNGEIMARIGQAGAKFSLLVVDACRDNPFPKKAGRSVGGTRGLAVPATPDGMIVVYSAGVGQQALDRLGDADRDPNGLFTREFVRELRRPGLEVAQLVRNVGQRVKEQAAKVKHQQTPAIYIQAGNFYLVPDAQSVTVQAAPVSAEDSLWAQFDPARPCEYRTYLEQYPQGKFAGLAKLRLKDCAPAKEAAPAAAEQPAAPKPAPPPVAAVQEDPETAFWNEVKANGAKEYYEAYVKQYPKGKYLPLAKLELKKIDDREKAQQAKEEAERKAELARLEAEKKAAAERERQDQQRAEQEAWERAKSADSEYGYRQYLDVYPKGRYATLAQAAQQKAQREAAEREKQAVAQRRAEEERQRAEAERQRLAAEQERREAEQRRQAQAASRPQARLIAERYRDNGDGTVTDVKTRLQWMRCSIGQNWNGSTCVGSASKHRWEDARQLRSNLAGHSDWRLPTRDELRSLVYCSSGQPATWNESGNSCAGTYQNPTIVAEAFPNTAASYFWSGSPVAGLSGYALMRGFRQRP